LKSHNIALFYVLFALLPVAAYGQSYTVADLGALGGQSSRALALNNAGDAVGYYKPDEFPYPNRAFIYTGGTTSPIAPTNYGSTANAINDAGQVTGNFQATPSSNRTYAFVYANGAFTNLGPLNSNPGGESVGNGINFQGTIVGQIQSPSIKGMIYNGGVMSTFNNANILAALAINSLGSTVGWLQNLHAFLMVGNRVQDIGTLDGGKDTASAATAINDSGQVVGYSSFGGNSTHAFLYQNGSMQDLGTLHGGYSLAFGINSQGDVVGESDGSAFLYRNGTMIDLRVATASGNFFGLERAFGINDSGQIAGDGTFLNIGTHAVLLTPQ